MSDEKSYSVLLPIIRRVMPDIIAETLFGVQPMANPFSKEEWAHRIDALSFAKYDQISDIKQWCSENLNREDWINNVQFFAFKTDEVYSWFILRWS